MLNREMESIKFFALGGLGEEGKNMYVVEIEEDLYILDSGLMFPEDGMLGIDIVIPDINFLVENSERIKGIFLSHGHEDHIGALPYVLNKISAPVYGTKLTLEIVRKKVKEVGIKKNLSLRVIDCDSILNFPTCKVSFFRVTHNIPDAVGICIHTSQGAIVYTGDFKIDQTPVDGKSTEIEKLASIGTAGTLCLLSNSTNAEVQGFTKSESSVREKINETFFKAEGRVIVASASSNIYRIQQVLDASVLTNRKVLIFGHNNLQSVESAMDLGYLKYPNNLIVSLAEIRKLNDTHVTILVTGSDQDVLMHLSKMVAKTDFPINIKPSDTILMAVHSKPRNEKQVSKTIDQLYRSRANVVYGQKLIHVSGHASQDELKMMLHLLKPKFVVPVHGDFRLQKAHAKLAEAVGVDKDNVYLLENGDVLEFKNQHAKVHGKVPAGKILVDGLGIGDVGNIVLRDRRLLSQDGILIVVVTLSRQQNKILSGPEIISRGFVYVRESEGLIETSSEMVSDILTKMMSEKKIDWSTIKNNIRDSLSHFLFEKTKRRPMILPIIMEI